MSLLHHTPHTATVVRPKTKSSGDSKASYLDYSDPQWSKSYKGLFQQRGGTIIVADAGAEVPYDSVFYTRETDIAAEDRVTIAQSPFAGVLFVVGVQAKCRLNGSYSHTEVTLRKDTR